MTDIRTKVLIEDIEKFKKNWSDYIFQGLQQQPTEGLGTQIYEVLSIFAKGIVANVSKEDSKTFLFLLKELGVAKFLAAMHPKQTIEISVWGQPLRIEGVETTVYVDADTWMVAYFSAVISRDMSAIKALCDVPENIHRNANLKPDVFDLALVKVLKGLFDPKANIGQLMVDAMEASDPENIAEQRIDYAEYILLPQLPLYRCFLSGDKNEFDEKLREAIELHNEYWQKGKNSIKPAGWIALPLICAAAIAYDNKGFHFEDNAPLMPQWLVYGQFD